MKMLHTYGSEAETQALLVPDTRMKAERKPLSNREIELIEGMIEVQLDHATRCDSMANRAMAEKQKAWDMERVELLRKLKENT